MARPVSFVYEFSAACCLVNGLSPLPYGLWEHGWTEGGMSDWFRDSATNFNTDWWLAP